MTINNISTNGGLLKIFKEIGFKIEIQTHLQIVNFLDVTFNLATGTYRPYKKANDPSLYTSTSSKHPPQVIKQLTTSFNERLNKNSPSEIFSASKYEYGTALKNSSYQQTELIFNKKKQWKQKRNRSQNIIWFNPPSSRNVTTSVAKHFFNLLDIHFPNSNKVHKIFNRITVKVSYCCTENLSSIIKTHNKKVTNEKITRKDQCNCRNKNDYPPYGKCQTSDIIYKCTASTTVNSDKIYLRAAAGNFKEQ